ncbi:MAG: hypothetical protein OXI91_10135 [Chloroflexota bacterium]|nr:hypothetical protein [Chloroflexota bacterium]
MEIPPMPPIPPDQRYWQAESEYRREQVQRGGIVSDLWASLEVLGRFLFNVASFPLGMVAKAWRRHSQKNATR